MLLEHERYYGSSMDAPGTRTLIWSWHGCSDDCMLRINLPRTMKAPGASCVCLAGSFFSIRMLQFAKTSPLGHDPPDRGPSSCDVI